MKKKKGRNTSNLIELLSIRASILAYYIFFSQTISIIWVDTYKNKCI